MNKKFKSILFFYLIINILNISNSNENFFNTGLELYKDKKYSEARFMFERSIVFNPKDSNSYLYLAKIYNVEKDQKKEEKGNNKGVEKDPPNAAKARQKERRRRRRRRRYFFKQHKRFCLDIILETKRASSPL